jgi:hypothetical protein
LVALGNRRIAHRQIAPAGGAARIVSSRPMARERTTRQPLGNEWLPYQLRATASCWVYLNEAWRFDWSCSRFCGY